MSQTWVLATVCTLCSIPMTSLYENDFHIIGLCDSNPPAADGFLSQEWPVMHRFYSFLAFAWTSRRISSGVVDLRYVMLTTMWSHWNVMVTIYKHYNPNPWQLDWNAWIYKWVNMENTASTYEHVDSQIKLACKLFMIFTEEKSEMLLNVPAELPMMMSSNGNKFRVTGRLWGEFISHRRILLTNASDSEHWCFPWPTPEQTVEQTIETPVIWDVISLIITSL